MSFAYKRVSDPVMLRKLENMEAELARQKATTDYIAMMADVEIPQEEVEENVVSEDQTLL